MEILIGSARKNEYGSFDVGAKGDQLQNAVDDYAGEVSLQKFYIHKKGWNIFRPISSIYAELIAERMFAACNNPNIGYSQNDRADIWKKGIDTNFPTNCDCSSLVRQCVIEATRMDVGNFTTASAGVALERTGLFLPVTPYSPHVPIFNGDILCTKTKGHIVIVTCGNPRKGIADLESKGFYPKLTIQTNSLYDGLIYAGEKDASFAHRAKIADANGIHDYVGNADQNMRLLEKLKNGTLRRV